MTASGCVRRFAPGLAALSCALLVVPGCGLFAMQRDQDATLARVTEMDKGIREEFARLRAELDATRDRLDNALKASADTGSDLMSEKSRLNELAGRLDETAHKLDELGSAVAAGRNEIDARVDQLTRAQAAQQPAPPAPPPVAIPATRQEHFAALEAAVKAKDYALVRTLGHEYVNRYAADEKADDALYQIGKADLDDGKPSSALGEWNRLLKLFPRSNMLEKTLFGMGQAYETMHDCANAKLAYGTVMAHFPHGKLAAEAHARTVAIGALPAGACAPP